MVPAPSCQCRHTSQRVCPVKTGIIVETGIPERPFQMQVARTEATGITRIGRIGMHDLHGVGRAGIARWRAGLHRLHYAGARRQYRRAAAFRVVRHVLPIAGEVDGERVFLVVR